MKPKHWTFAEAAARYQLQLRLATPEAPAQPSWDRSGARRKFALRSALLSELNRGPESGRRQ